MKNKSVIKTHRSAQVPSGQPRALLSLHHDDDNIPGKLSFRVRILLRGLDTMLSSSVQPQGARRGMVKTNPSSICELPFFNPINTVTVNDRISIHKYRIRLKKMSVIRSLIGLALRREILKPTEARISLY